METGVFLAISFALLVLGVFKFNTWTSEEKQVEPYENPPRDFTTWMRFYGFALLYSSTLVGLYLFCVYLPDIVIEVAKALEVKPDWLNLEELNKRNPPAISGIILFIFFYAFLLRYDGKWRGWVHEQAFIPDHAKALINHFNKHPYTFQPNLDEMRSLLAADGVIDDPLAEQTVAYFKQIKEQSNAVNCTISPAPETLSRLDITILWAKILYLKNRLERALSQTCASACIKKCKKRKVGLDLDFNHLRALVVIYFAFDITDDEKELTALNILKTEIQSNAQKTLAKLYLIDCCAVLKLTLSEKDRVQEFAKLGLTAPFSPPPPAIPAGTVFAGLLAVFFIGLLSTFWFDYIADKSAATLNFNVEGKSIIFALMPEDSMNTVLWPFYSLLLHGIAVVFSLGIMQLMYKKQRSAGQTPANNRTVWSEIIALLATGLICLPTIIFLVVITIDQLPWLLAFKIALPWSFVPMTTAFFSVVYLNDVLQRQNQSSWWRKAGRSILQGGTTGLMSLIAIRMLLNIADLPTSTQPNASLLYFQIYAVFLPAAIGAVLGYVLPSGYENYLIKEYRSIRREIRQSARSERVPALVG
jgi:hypothetical protein